MTDARLPAIGTISTMPSRMDSFAQVLDRVLPQLDRLYVFLDGFAEVPGLLIDSEKVCPVMVPAADTLFASNRFRVGQLLESEADIVCVDDDILYPADYVQAMRGHLNGLSRPAIVGVHGDIFIPPYLSYVRHRIKIHFSQALKRPAAVNALGTGTVVYRSSTLRFDPRSWQHPGLGDLSLAVEAAKANVPMICVERPARWLEAIDEGQADSLWTRAQRDESRHVALMRELVRLQVS